jgi:hypothetical protein
MKKARVVVAKQKKNEDIIIESPTNRYENVRRYCRYYYGVDF